MTRPLANLIEGEPYQGDNLAIIAASYCNVSLRLGYHFNVIDAYCSERAEENSIYFRFVGGFASEEKRRRRVGLIATILTGLHFRVEQKGDLLIAKAKLLEAAEMERTLSRIGALVSFTRQLDVRMVDDRAVDLAFERFLALVTHQEGSIQSPSRGDRTESPLLSDGDSVQSPLKSDGDEDVKG